MGPRRLIAAFLTLALSIILFVAGNLLAADVRYPLAIFCLVLSIVSFGVALCLFSRRLGRWFGGLVAEVLEWWP